MVRYSQDQTLVNTARRLRDELATLRRAAADPRTPRLARWLVVGALAYALSPIDLIPDFVPLLGHLDDVLVVPLALWLAIRLIPNEVLAEHRQQTKPGAGEDHRR